MIVTNQAHIDLLNSRVFWGVDLYEFVLADGSTLRFLGNTGSISTTWEGKTYQAGGPIFKREGIRQARGLESEEVTFDIIPHDDDLLLGLPWRDAIRNGAFNGAQVTICRGHAPLPGAPLVGVIMLCCGKVKSWDFEHEIRITARSAAVDLDAQQPRATFGPGCDRTLFDAGCGVSRAAYQSAAQAQPNSTQRVLRTSLGHAEGYFSGGEIWCQTGRNAGARRSIKSQGADGVLVLTYPFNMPVTVGDTFAVWPGCSHAKDETGCLKFNNLALFRGEPDVPVPETAY